MVKMRVCFVAAAMLTMAGSGALAKTVVVGPAACQPSYQHYSTIQSAVDAVQSVTSANTVLVCPGIYPEQVVISLPVVVKTVEYQGALEAVLTVPPGGLVPNATTPIGIFAAQVVMQNATGIKVINLTLDGTGSACPADIGADRTAGLLAVNIGDPTTNTSGGTVQQLVVRNQKNGCGTADGIVAHNSFITITGNSVHDVDRSAIVQMGGEGNITTNTIQGCSDAGILLTSGSSGMTLSSNSVSFCQFGVRLDGTDNIFVKSSDFGPYVGIGVYLESCNATRVESSRFIGGYAGVWANMSSASTVRTNVIIRTQAFALANTLSRGGATQFTSNTVNEAQFGLYTIYEDPTDIYTPNTYMNVKVKTTQNPWQ